MICEIDGWVLGGVQLGCWCRCCLGVLFGELFVVLVTVPVHCCETDSRVLGGMQVTVRAQFCKIDRRVL